MDNRHHLYFDFETSSADPATTQILQIGAYAVDRRSLEIRDQFKSLVKPEDFDTLEEGALKVNGLTREELMEAPEVGLVFPTWASWIQKFNINKNHNSFGAPIPCYYGGDNFDMPILNRYAKRFGYWDNKWRNQTLLNPIFSFDVMRHLWFWFNSATDAPDNLKLATVLEYMGVPKKVIEEGAHDALWDVHWTYQIGKKLMRVANYLTCVNDQGSKRLEMRGCFANEPTAI